MANIKGDTTLFSPLWTEQILKGINVGNASLGIFSSPIAINTALEAAQKGTILNPIYANVTEVLSSYNNIFQQTNILHGSILNKIGIFDNFNNDAVNLPAYLQNSTKSMFQNLHPGNDFEYKEIATVGDQLNTAMKAIPTGVPITLADLENFKSELVNITKEHAQRLEGKIGSAGSGGNNLAIVLFILSVIISYCIYFQGKIDSKDLVTKSDLHEAKQSIISHIDSLHLDSLKRTTKRSAKLRTKPRHGSWVKQKIEANSTVIILNTQGPWVDTLCVGTDSIAVQGWLLKKYLLR